MSVSSTNDKTRSLLGLLVALPLTALTLAAMYGAVGLI